MKIQELVSYCIFYTDYHPIIKYFHTDKQFEYFFQCIMVIQDSNTHNSFFLWICVSKFMCAKSLYKTVCSIVVYGINFIIYYYNRINRHRLLALVTFNDRWTKFVLLSYVRIVWEFLYNFNSNWDSIRDERLYIQYVVHFEMDD
jgi:hypothetical protein